MPESHDIIESQILKVYEAIKREKKPNISALSREFDVPRRRLYTRIQTIYDVGKRVQ